MATFLAWGGAIVLFGNICGVIYKLVKPGIAMREKVRELDMHDKTDYKRLAHLEDQNREQCKALLAIINHMIDGNHVEQMKKTRESIINLLDE